MQSILGFMWVYNGMCDPKLTGAKKGRPRTGNHPARAQVARRRPREVS